MGAVSSLGGVLGLLFFESAGEIKDDFLANACSCSTESSRTAIAQRRIRAHHGPMHELNSILGVRQGAPPNGVILFVPWTAVIKRKTTRPAVEDLALTGMSRSAWRLTYSYTRGDTRTEDVSEWCMTEKRMLYLADEPCLL